MRQEAISGGKEVVAVKVIVVVVEEIRAPVKPVNLDRPQPSIQDYNKLVDTHKRVVNPNN